MNWDIKEHNYIQEQVGMKRPAAISENEGPDQKRHELEQSLNEVGTLGDWERGTSAGDQVTYLAPEPSILDASATMWTDATGGDMTLFGWPDTNITNGTGHELPYATLPPPNYSLQYEPQEDLEDWNGVVDFERPGFAVGAGYSSLDGIDLGFEPMETHSGTDIQWQPDFPEAVGPLQSIGLPNEPALTPDKETESFTASTNDQIQGHDHLPTPTRDETHMIETPRGDKVCFGVLVVETTLASSNTKASAPEKPPLKAQTRNGVLGLYEGEMFVGLFISEALGSLSVDFPSVEFTPAFQPAPPSKSKAKSSKEPHKDPKGIDVLNTDRVMRLVVYGFMEDRNEIGRQLSDAELFLQHPLPSEVNPQAEYFNPHLLLRPGASMPRIEDLRIVTKEEGVSPPAPTTLDDVSKSRIWKVFDHDAAIEVLPDIKPSPRLKSILREHQLTALEMMVERECGVIDGAKFPTLWELSRYSTNRRYRHKVTGWYRDSPIPIRGGVLADEMGLGKTLSTLSLICWSLDATENGKGVADVHNGMTLIVAPKTTLIGWERQIKVHVDEARLAWIIYHGPARHKLLLNLDQNNVILTTYEVLRQDFATKETQETLYSHQFHRVVLDEAHRMRSRSSQIHQAAIAIASVSQNRWCLTGTPIHNSLDDYGALLAFLHVPGLSDKRDFDRHVAAPLKNKMSGGLKSLQDLVRGTSLRRTMSRQAEALGLEPPISNTVYVELQNQDGELYEFFRDRCSRLARESSKGKTTTIKTVRKRQATSVASGGRRKGDDNILSLIGILRIICNYGERVLSKRALQAWATRDGEALDFQALQDFGRKCSVCSARLSDSEVSDALPCGHEVCVKCKLDADVADDDNEEKTLEQCGACAMTTRTELDPDISGNRGLKLHRPAKIDALLRILRQEQEIVPGNPSIKSVVFSYWVTVLDLLQNDLQDAGFGTARVDGQTSLELRRREMGRFQEDSTCTVMLASIGSAGEGIDLLSANHVHILEPQWNPMAETQAIARVYRLGQMRQVTVTRYVTTKSIETYVQWIQSDKLRLITLSLDDESPQQDAIDERRLNELQKYLEQRAG